MERAAYQAYGQPTFANAAGTTLSSSAKATRYSYTGREWDPSLELHHFRARWMSGVIGRFCTVDPQLYEACDPSLYRYVFNQPIDALDPTGMDVWVEGHSGDEPVGHQSICVGDPFGAYDCFSFSLEGVSFQCWGLDGEVYEGEDHLGGVIDPKRYIKTPPIIDDLIRFKLRCYVGQHFPYRLLNANCRWFSQSQFDEVCADLKSVGLSPKAPPNRPVPPLPPVLPGRAGCSQRICRCTRPTSTSSTTTTSTADKLPWPKKGARW